MKMRAYQQRIIGNVHKAFETEQRTLIVAATGTGKTQMFSTIAKSFLDAGRRVMVLCHRDELIQQACSRLRVLTGVLPTVEKADQWSDEQNIYGKPPLVVSSIQTQSRGRMHRFNPNDFGLVIADEAHHAVADSWKKVIDHYASNEACKVLGVTATPDRADGEMLGTMFQSVADTYSLIDAVDDGYLVPVCPWSIEIEGLDFSKVHTLAGDFNQGELEEAMMFEKPLHGVAFATIESACGLQPNTLRQWLDAPDRSTKLQSLLAGRVPKKCLVFCVSVAHAERMAEIFKRWIPDSADVVSGKLCDEDRADRLKAFKKGSLRFLCNCMIATEGFDEPSIEMVVMARPTKSRSLFVQMLGRGTRPAEEIAGPLGEVDTPDERRAMVKNSSKPFLNVLDFVGNSGRHEVVTTVDIFGDGYAEEEIELAKELTDSGDMEAGEALEASREALEKKRRESELRRKEMEEKRRRQAMESSRQGLVGAATYKIGAVEEWDNAPPHILPRHANIFRKAKVPLKDVVDMNDETRGELCRKIVMHWQMNLCSYKQAKCLLRAGWKKEELDRMTFQDASKAMDCLARSHWNGRAARMLMGA